MRLLQAVRKASERYSEHATFPSHTDALPGRSRVGNPIHYASLRPDTYSAGWFSRV